MSAPPSPEDSARRSPSLTLDLTDLPALSKPAPPSNTLLITNLQAPEIFSAGNLDNIQRAIGAHATIHTFAPLKSFRRIIVTLYSVDAALEIRKALDGELLLGHRVRVFFGRHTNTDPAEDQHLQAPKSQKLFFISPPPSPPVGWQMRNEDPPNKDVHADDLATALARLNARSEVYDERDGRDHGREGHASFPGDFGQGNRPGDGDVAQVSHINTGSNRQRAGSSAATTVLFDPQEHGSSSALPAIALEDTGDDAQGLENSDDMIPGTETKFIHTSRPPVELMET